MTFRIALLMSFFLFLQFQADAQSIAQRKQHFHTDKKGLAIDGYDPVSYFGQKPQKGKKDHSYQHDGITYYFVSVENKNAFITNPDKYEPAYGGWCAYAMAQNGEKVDVDPLTYKIVDGRLLLFYNRLFTNTLGLWNELKKPEAQRVTSANEHWKKFISN
ncbi:MAG: hypothetical protein JNK77_06705 [Saprospiraceae bacterium]|nr:hypothetical protein [Saprospiraceae bacterium]